MRTNGRSSLAIFAALTFLSAGCGGHKKSSTAPAVPAITTASPAGGGFTAVQSVTLTSDRPATIHYSVDGNDPSVGGSNTTSGASPITGILIPDGTTVLKFFSVTPEGAIESVRSERYAIDAAAPTISFVSPPPPAFGVLTSATIRWQSNEAGSYVVELGGNGSIGTGRVLYAGSAAAGQEMALEVKGTELSFSAPRPLWVYVTDVSNHIGSASLALRMKPLGVIPNASGWWNIAIAPSGLRVYVPRAGNVAVIDSDPSSSTYNEVVATVAVAAGGDLYGIAVSPDGSRVYVTDQQYGTISVISTAANSVVDATAAAGTYPTGIAITPDGTRAYYTTADQWIRVLDTNPASPGYLHAIASIYRSGMDGFSSIAIAPNGTMAVVNWQGFGPKHAIDLIDTNPSSPTFNMIVASPVPLVSANAGDVVMSPDNAYAYAVDGYRGVSKISLGSREVVLGTDGGGQSGIAVTPDGAHVLNAWGNLRVFDAATLLDEGTVEVGAEIFRVVVSPDGSRAYCLSRSTTFDVICVPLL